MTEIEKQARKYANSISNTILEKLIAEKAYIKGHQDTNKWIDCNDRLPEKEDVYNVYVTNIGVGSLSFINGLWTMPLFKTIVIENVSHWMPLPDKPLK
jgi:hypothetical protein